jgi:hypothetical protein
LLSFGSQKPLFCKDFRGIDEVERTTRDTSETSGGIGSLVIFSILLSDNSLPIYPIYNTIENYNLPKPDAVHFMRLLRSFIHGFAELSGNGLMLKSSVSKEDSFRHIVQQLLSYLKEYKNHE